MNLLPVIERELRAEARHSSTYWLRPVGAGAVLIAAAYTLLVHPVRLGAGGELFADLHKLLFATIWLLVPLMTADCVSREKREQTLGLLFLTPLKPGEIMVAKAFVHGLRAGAIGIAALPMLVLPVLLGGVDWQAATASVLINASAFLWALAAGLLASTLSRSIASGLIWALIWAAVFLVALSILQGLAVYNLINATTGRNINLPPPRWFAGIGLITLWSTDSALFGMFRAGTPFPKERWIFSCLVMLLCSFGGLLIVWRVSAWRLRSAWQELPPSREQVRLAREFCQPRFFTARFRRRMVHQIERNPVGWLERRHWLSRTAAWGWMAVLAVVFTYKLMSLHSLRDFNGFILVVVLGLAVAFALSASASLRRERESGVMELLLTTPLTPGQIVSGRLRGMWRQFLPVMTLYGSVTALMYQGNFGAFSADEIWLAVGMAALFYLTVPVTGLWFSLRSRHFVTSLLLTIIVGIVLPLFLVIVLARCGFPNRSWQPLATLVFIAALGGCAIGIGLMRESLGWFGIALVTTFLLASAAKIFLVIERYGLQRIASWEEPIWIFLVFSGVTLALAGFGHVRLVRRLHQRRFAYQV